MSRVWVLALTIVLPACGGKTTVTDLLDTEPPDSSTGGTAPGSAGTSSVATGGSAGTSSVASGGSAGRAPSGGSTAAAGTVGTGGRPGIPLSPVCEGAIARLSSTHVVPVVGCANEACHNAANPQAPFVLLPDPAATMRGRLATYRGVLDPENCPPAAEVLLVPGDPDASLFIRKLRGTQACGSRMPNLPPIFTGEEISCLEDWVRGLD